MHEKVFEKVIELINYGERKSGLARDLRSRKIKGFQRMVRAKITKFYSFISSVLGTKLKVISKNIK